MILAFLAVAAATVPPITLPADLETRVEIDGHTFRVKVDGREVVVADKAIFVTPSPELRDKMRRAVLAVTGCRLDDPYWDVGKLRGLLICTAE